MTQPFHSQTFTQEKWKYAPIQRLVHKCSVLLIIANTKWHKCLSTDEWKKGNSGKFIQQNTTQQSKEWTVGTCNNIAESQNINNYGEYKKPDKKRIYTKWLCL